MSTRQLIAPLGLLFAAALVCQTADGGPPRKKRAARKTARQSDNRTRSQFRIQLATSDLQNAESIRKQRRRRQLTGQTGPQRAAIKYQLKPERFKVKEPPPWVPNQSRGKRRPSTAAGPQIYPERYTADLGRQLHRPRGPRARIWAGRPDLVVKQFVFTGSKIVRVKIANVGRVAAGKSVARLTVRRINGTPVGRMTYAKTPPIPANSFKWVSFNAKKILPVAVKLKDTTFRVDADVTNAVAELKETNNRRWHNLSP